MRPLPRLFPVGAIRTGLTPSRRAGRGRTRLRFLNLVSYAQPGGRRDKKTRRSAGRRCRGWARRRPGIPASSNSQILSGASAPVAQGRGAVTLCAAKTERRRGASNHRTGRKDLTSVASLPAMYRGATRPPHARRAPHSPLQRRATPRPVHPPQTTHRGKNDIAPAALRLYERLVGLGV